MRRWVGRQAGRQAGRYVSEKGSLAEGLKVLRVIPPETHHCKRYTPTLSEPAIVGHLKKAGRSPLNPNP